VAELGPNKKLTAKLLRSLGTNIPNERRTVWIKLHDAKVSWCDVGDAYECYGEPRPDDGKFTEAELQEYGQAMRAEGVEAGIKIGQARARNGSSNGHGYTLPEAAVMVEYCHQQLGWLRSDTERDFIDRVYPRIKRGINLSLRELGFLMSVYTKTGGKT
jgi:hypothetical protein